MIGVCSTLDCVEQQLRDNLPRLNTLVERGEMGINAFVGVAKGMVDDMRSTLGPCPALMPKAFAWRTLKLLGFLVGSTERHFQTIGKPPGSTWASMPDAECFMDSVAKVVGLPPVLSTYHYWLDDCGRNTLSFTGEAGELLFKECVQVWDRRTAQAGDVLRPICRGQTAIDSSDAIEAITTATECFEAICKRYEVLRRKDANGHRGLDPEVFNRMRNYLVGYPVAGKFSTGPNAANLRSNWSADFTSGVVDETYPELIRDRLEFLTPEDRRIVLADMTSPSVTGRFLSGLGLSRRDLLATDTTAITRQILRQTVGFRTALAAYKALHKAILKLSAMHWQSIVNLLIKPFASMTPEELAKLPVPPTKSVGNAGHDRPEAIFLMRKNNPVVNKLIQALDQLSA